MTALALAVAAGCGGDTKAPSNVPPPDAKRVDEAKAGQVAGRVTIDGSVPANPGIPMGSDPVCARQHPDGAPAETFVVGQNGGLDNVFVYVKDGLGNYFFETPVDAVTLDQRGCQYTPHVFGVRVGQPIEIINSDPTMHNVLASADVNRGFNFGQAIQGMKTTQSFTAPEVMVQFKCNVHPWMVSYAGVVAHPYFAVTKNGGRFELKNLPAGTYAVEAWHEKLGTQTQSITLAENEKKDVTFTFRATLP